MTRLEDSCWGGLPGEHPDSGLLIRLLDGELSEHEVRLVRSHAFSCPVCKESFRGWADLTTDLELFARNLTTHRVVDSRKLLEQKLSGTEGEVKRRVRANRIGSAWGAPRIPGKTYAWVTMVAAVVLILALVPREKRLFTSGRHHSQFANAATIDINGESFTLLPYSDPELPMNAPRIVEMQVPISSLAAAGVVVESTADLSPQSDRTVLANVLLGIDGQPLGVHVLNTD